MWGDGGGWGREGEGFSREMTEGRGEGCLRMFERIRRGVEINELRAGVENENEGGRK